MRQEKQSKLTKTLEFSMVVGVLVATLISVMWFVYIGWEIIMSLWLVISDS